MEHYFDNLDALSEWEMGKHLDNSQRDDFRKTVEEEDIEPGYRCMLCFILNKVETRKHREGEGCESENDPQYELFLSRLKEDGKSYVVEGENNEVIKYEAEWRSGDESGRKRRRKMKKRGLLSDRVSVNKSRSDLNLVERKKSSLRKNELSCRDSRASLVPINSRLDKGKNVVRYDHEFSSESDSDRKSNRTTQLQTMPFDSARPATKCKVQTTRGKIKGKKVVSLSKLYDRVQLGLVEGDKGRSSQKTDFKKYGAKGYLDGDVKAESSRKLARGEIRSVKSERLVVRKNDIDPDVEILDDAAIRKQGIMSTFVPSLKFHESSKDADFQNIGSTSACYGFRKEVLDVLKKPFDEEELKNLRQAVKDGSYYQYYPDLERKLIKCRYKRKKCLNIFRGFFFWLQNASQEGIFKPWKDGQCLAVEPGAPEISPANRAKKSKGKILK